MSHKKNSRKTGNSYEKIAGEYLEKCGYQILEYNFRCPYSEIDIVALDGDCFVFCEVKYRKKRAGVQPLEAVDRKKQKRISMAALFYISKKELKDAAYRFDVIGITGENILLIKNAFNYMGGLS